MAKILLVEDNVTYAKAIVNWLESQHFVVDSVDSGEDALQLLSNFSYDLIILDWELPALQGITVCERFRKNGGSAPIIFLTAREDAASKIKGLDTGADDYLVKPFEFRELEARMKALMRRPPGLLPNVLSVPGVSLELETRVALVAGKRVSLSPRESGVLEHLMRNTNRAFSSKELLAAIWPDDTENSEGTVRSCVRSLRKKLQVEGQDCVVKTSEWSGYLIESK